MAASRRRAGRAVAAIRHALLGATPHPKIRRARSTRVREQGALLISEAFALLRRSRRQWRERQLERRMERMGKETSERTSTTDIQHAAEALACVATFLLAAQGKRRKNALKVRGGRARARNAARDARGKFLPGHSSSSG